MDPGEREIDRLEELLGQSDDPQERKEIIQEIRDVEREWAEESRWMDEGLDRGWM